MFEVRAYIGPYVERGVTSYQDAAGRARELADKEGQPFIVNEIVMRCIIKPNKGPPADG